jgi:hypothetical protein
MQWSKLKKRFEDRVAPCFAGKLRVHVTEYRNNSMDVGRGWITVDGEQIASVQIPSFYDDHITFSPQTLDFGAAVGIYVDISVEQALQSKHPIVQALGFLDKKLGKRRLKAIDPEILHPFPLITFKLRCEREGLPIATAPVTNSDEEPI